MTKAGRSVLILALLVTLAVFLVGLLTDLSLGDEVYQYRFAQIWYENGDRPVFDPLLETTNRCLYYFDSDPLWAMGLIFLWKIAGEVSIPVMQLYQAAFLGGIILLAYLLGKKLYGEEIGLYSALVAASCPFLVAYSVISYLDVPTIFFVLLAALLLVKQRFFAAGIAAGLGFLMKRNTWLFIPILTLYLLTRKKNPIKSTAQFAFPAGLIGLPELLFHFRVWNDLFFPPGCVGPDPIAPTWNWTPSNIFYNPISILQYFGITVLIFLFLYLILRSNKTRDLFLLVPISIYILEWSVLVPDQIAIRYYAPLFGFFSILGAVGFSEFLSRTSTQKALLFRVSLAAVAGLQLIGTLIFLTSTRQITQDVKEGFQFIIRTTQQDARVMYPEYTLSLETGRRVVWIYVSELEELFWEADENRVREIFDSYQVYYLMVKKERIYDDSEVHHRLGYPESFLNKLYQYDWVELIFENAEVQILKFEP